MSAPLLQDRHGPERRSIPITMPLAELQMCSATTAVRLEDVVRSFILDDPNACKPQQFYDAPFAGNRVIPWIERPPNSRLMHPHVLSIMLRLKPPEATAVTVYPPIDIVFRHTQVALDLINNLDDMDNASSNAVVLFPTNALDKLIKPLSKDETTQFPDLLETSEDNQISIIPHGAVLPLELTLSVNCIELHCMTGVRVYLVWPPTPHNMAHIRQHLLDLQNGMKKDPIEACEGLEDGSSFILRPGWTAYLPPYCLSIVLATKTSAAMEYRSRYIEGIALRVRHLDLLPLQIAALNLASADLRSSALRKRAHELEHDVSKLIGPDVELTDLRNPNHHTGNLIAEYGRKGVSQKFENLLRQHAPGGLLRCLEIFWTLAYRRNLLKKCHICQRGFEGRYGRHFVDQHWPKAPLQAAPDQGRDVKGNPDQEQVLKAIGVMNLGPASPRPAPVGVPVAENHHDMDVEMTGMVNTETASLSLAPADVPTATATDDQEEEQRPRKKAHVASAPRREPGGTLRKSDRLQGKGPRRKSGPKNF